ncbi:MAG TPA: hypothetical protein VF327_02580 [Gaiellaceae bacterium]
MDPREATEIMSQGAIQPETSRDREERRTLEADLATSPLKGQPLRPRLRNFRPDADAAIRALGGPPRWMRRLREIEDGLEWHEVFLEDAWRTLARKVDDPDEFARRWEETADTWRFARINKAIDQHNRNFPAEARLPMDPKTRDFVRINGRSYERALLDAEWILEQFPADLAAARGA